MTGACAACGKPAGLAFSDGASVLKLCLPCAKMIASEAPTLPSVAEAIAAHEAGLTPKDQPS
jgi:hypothetical protein